MTENTVGVRASLTITINDEAPEDVFTRGQNPAWFPHFYGQMSRDDIIAHWAHNAVANGVDDVSLLDGWADLPRWSVELRVDSVEVES